MRVRVFAGALLAGLVSLLSARTLPAQSGAVAGGPLPGPLPLFPADNWWNVDVSQAPVDPASDAFLAFVGRNRGLHPDFGGDVAGSFPDVYGMIYLTVPGNEPLEPVAFDYVDESDPGAPGRPSGYPIPVEAKTQTHWIEGGRAGNATVDGDKHMLIVDRDNRLLFETWNTRCLPSGSATCTWNAGSGAVFPLDANLRRPDGWTSADAAGLAILPGLVRYDEAFGTAPIRHAFRVTVRATNGYVFPASHRAGSTAGALPMGARLRLKSGKEISGFPDPVRRIFQAMKTYGLIVADNGSDMFVSGTYDTRWDNDVLNPAFASLTAGDFEVLTLGWSPSSTGSDPCAPLLGAGCSHWWLPSSAHKQGTNGAFYRTDLTVANTGTSDLAFVLKFLGNNVDGTAGAERPFTLGAGRSVTYADVLGTVFGLADAFGAIQIRSASPSLAALSQTATPGFGGTFGQAVPVVPDAELVRAGAPRSILAVREDAAFRTNLFLANATGAPLVVDVALRDEAGATMGSGSYSVPPLGMVQVSHVVRDLGAAANVAGARLVLSTSTPGGAFAAYASVIDATTNDPRTLLPR